VASPSGLLHRFQASLPWRAWQRYGKARGGVLAGGMAYAAFFSIFPALAVGFTVFGLVVGDHDDLRRQVIDAVNDGIGTTIISSPGKTDGIVGIDQLTGSNTLTVTGIIGLVGLLLTGLGWMDALREGVRAMFGQPTLEGNVVMAKLRDLGVLVSIGVILLASAIGGVLVGGAAETVLGWVGLDGSTIGRVVLVVVSTLLLLGVDLLLFLVIFRLLAGVDVARHDLWDAALFGAIGLGILKLFAGLLVGNAGHNTFLAAAGVLLGLLVWLNLVSRLTLIAASWGATVAIERGHLVVPEQEQPGGTVPVRREPSGPATPARPAGSTRPTAVGTAVASPAPAAPFTPDVGRRAADRVSVAAGAVLGAVGLYVVRTGLGAVRTVVSSARRSDD
jgi:membrane protein